MKTYIVHRDGLAQPELIRADSATRDGNWWLFYMDGEVFVALRDALLVADKELFAKSGSLDEVQLELAKV